MKIITFGLIKFVVVYKIGIMAKLYRILEVAAFFNSTRITFKSALNDQTVFSVKLRSRATTWLRDRVSSDIVFFVLYVSSPLYEFHLRFHYYLLHPTDR